MAEEQSRSSLAFQISNHTQNITLRFHRSDREFQSSLPPSPELPPGLSDCFEIFSNPDSPGVEQLLVYEAESFTLAIFVHVCPEPEDSLSVLHLELSPVKAHLSDGEQNFSRMKRAGDPPGDNQTPSARCRFSKRSGGNVRLSAGACTVTATAGHGARPLLEVELREPERVGDRENREFPSCGIL